MKTSRKNFHPSELKNNGNNQVDHGKEICSEIIDCCDDGMTADYGEEYVCIEEADVDLCELNYSTESLQNFITTDASEMEKNSMIKFPAN